MLLRLNLIAVAALLLLTSCGFHPMYGNAAMQAEHTPLQGNIFIDPISGGHLGQILKNALEDRFNPEGITYAKPDYELQIKLTKSLIPTVVRSDGTTLRNEVRLDSTFILLRTGNKTPIFTGAVRRSGSFNTSINENFATYEAEQDITERTLVEMSEDYMLRMAGYFAHSHNDVVPVVDPNARKTLF